MKKLKPLFVILTAALILFSAVCFLYPAISNAINEQYNESRIDDYNNNVDSFSQEDLDGYFSVAEKYNDALATDVSMRAGSHRRISAVTPTRTQLRRLATATSITSRTTMPDWARYRPISCSTSSRAAVRSM